MRVRPDIERIFKFRTTNATAMLRLSRPERLARLAELCLNNADALFASLHYCAVQGIGAFRINSQILPIKAHPPSWLRHPRTPARPADHGRRKLKLLTLACGGNFFASLTIFSGTYWPVAQRRIKSS